MTTVDKSPRPRYFNRELSWLEFNQRVLEEACTVAAPVFERLKFLAITASNLDEFFMVRVGGLVAMRQAGKRRRDAAGLTPKMQLEAIEVRVRAMVEQKYACFRQLFGDELPAVGIRRFGGQSLSPEQEARIREIFHEELFPILSPMVLEPAAKDMPVPILRNLQVYVGIRLPPSESGGRQRLAVIPIAEPVERIVQLPAPDGGLGLLFVEDAIKRYVKNWFAGQEILETTCFRITRNADIAVQEDEALDLVSGMEDVLHARTESDCLRLELESDASDEMERLLLAHFGTRWTQVFRNDGALDLDALMSLAMIDGRDELKAEPWSPQSSPAVDQSLPLFEQIKQNDIVLYHPYEYYKPVVRFIQEAASDPDVLAIKQVLYRAGSRSPIIDALQQAAKSGKYVTVLVELKARFDEARNIDWARQLEKAGVQVVYGVKGLKTHAKVCLVIRRETHGMARYVHFGTGNYNDATARLYGDVSFMTCRPDLGTDAALFFNAICGRSQPSGLTRLAMAPFTLRDKLAELIEGEIHRATHNLGGRIDAKMNSLVDPVLIDNLYRASQAGVKINLNVRGVCCLRPGVAGLSENIQVISILDRYLEHARIFRFRHGGDDLVFISSADWMPRNLDRRVELMVPVDDANGKNRLLEILDIHLEDRVKGWKLAADGTYTRRRPHGDRQQSSQQILYQMAVKANEEAHKRQPTVLEPHLPSEVED